MSLNESVRSFFIDTYDFNNFNQVALFLYAVVYILLLRKHPVKLKILWLAPIVSIYFGLVGANMFAVFFNGTDSVYLVVDLPLSILMLKAFSPFFEYGQVMYGGYFGSIVGVLIFSLFFKNRNEFLPKLLDVSSISITLLFAVWRVGCFIDGCCYGKPSENFGIIFAKHSQAYRYLEGTSMILPDGSGTVPLIPTQLISLFANLMIFLFLVYLFNWKKIRYPFFYFFFQAFLYGTFRFTIEFFRMDLRQYWGFLTISQWIPLLTMPFISAYFYLNWGGIKKAFQNSKRT